MRARCLAMQIHYGEAVVPLRRTAEWQCCVRRWRSATVNGGLVFNVWIFFQELETVGGWIQRWRDCVVRAIPTSYSWWSNQTPHEQIRCRHCNLLQIWTLPPLPLLGSCRRIPQWRTTITASCKSNSTAVALFSGHLRSSLQLPPPPTPCLCKSGWRRRGKYRWKIYSYANSDFIFFNLQGQFFLKVGFFFLLPTLFKPYFVFFNQKMVSSSFRDLQTHSTWPFPKLFFSIEGGLIQFYLFY